MRHGFSLVELSIVLVILGLLVGGVMSGQSLIRAAELRAVTTERDRYLSAVYTFRDKYFALPGDMPNATQFWSAAANCPGTNAQGTTDGTTCDGDGDGRIERINTAPFGNEQFRVWQHLANAGLIEGTYNGVTGTGSTVYHSMIDTNVPRSKLSNAGWSIYYHGTDSGNDYWFAMDYGHILIFGAQHSTAATINPVLTPEEAWNIDTKVDDGKPGRGTVIAHWWDDCTTATANNELDAEYLLSESSTVCNLNFRKLF